MIGVAILCYEGFSDLVMSLTALKQNTRLRPDQVEFIVFDNSEKTTSIREHVLTAHPDVFYQTIGMNTGCTRSRNIIYHEFLKRHPDAEYLAIIDQDIEVQPGWLGDMLEVAGKHEDCGVVAWPQAYRLKHPPVDGVVSEVASMCNLHALKPLKEVEEKWGGPFDEQFFFHKFDSLICQRLNQLGYRTRLVMKYYRHGVRWERQAGGIVHHHPHQGVRRNPRCNQIIKKSKRLYAQLQRREGWKNWYPAQPAEAAPAPAPPKPEPSPPREKPKKKKVESKVQTVATEVGMVAVRRSGKTLKQLLEERRKRRYR